MKKMRMQMRMSIGNCCVASASNAMEEGDAVKSEFLVEGSMRHY